MLPAKYSVNPTSKTEWRLQTKGRKKILSWLRNLRLEARHPDSGRFARWRSSGRLPLSSPLFFFFRSIIQIELICVSSYCQRNRSESFLLFAFYLRVFASIMLRLTSLKLTSGFGNWGLRNTGCAEISVFLSLAGSDYVRLLVVQNIARRARRKSGKQGAMQFFIPKISFSILIRNILQ